VTCHGLDYGKEPHRRIGSKVSGIIEPVSLKLL
jgi:hypothetical protein